ncbi:LOW QUALITY PROTEIN: upstream stimulatory factor 2 [Salvelinus alpinus]
MDQMMERMDRWERSGLPTSSPAPPIPALPVPATASSSGALRLTLPREYDGTVAGCQGFLLQLELYLATVRPTPSEEESVSALVSCLTGRALEWANAVWNGPDSARDHYHEFTRRFRAVFDHPPEGRAAGERLFHLRQETRSVQDFALEFRTLAAGAGPPAPIPMELGGAASRGTGGGVSSCTNCGRRGHTADRCWRNSSGSREGRRSTTRSPQHKALVDSGTGNPNGSLFNKWPPWLTDMLHRLPPIFKTFLKREAEEVLQLESRYRGVVMEEQTAVTIQSVQQAEAFADHNVQYQFRTEDSPLQLTYHVVVTDDQLEAAGDGTGAVSVVSIAAFTGAQQAVAHVCVCNPFSNGGSPAEEMVGEEMRFAYFSADTVRDGAAKAVSVQADPTFTQAGGHFNVMMSPPDVLQAGTPRTIAPRTHTYSFTCHTIKCPIHIHRTTMLPYLCGSPHFSLPTPHWNGLSLAKPSGNDPICIYPPILACLTLQHGSSNWKMDGPRAPWERRAQHNEMERRRRDKINSRIITLSKIILDCNIDSTKTGAKKGEILSKCDYFWELRQNNQRLQDHFKEMLRVQADNQLLTQQVYNVHSAFGKAVPD